MSVLERFWNKVDVRGPDECWPWRTSSDDAYGKFSVKRPPGRLIGAHVFSWIIANRSDIPAGLLVLHSCDFKKCVNPRHLSLGTYSKNAQEAVERGLVDLDHMRSFRRPATHCLRGHELTDESVYVTGDRRRCKACHAIRAKKYRPRDNEKRRARRARERAQQ